MTNTDPAGFDSEATGAFHVRSLTEKEQEFAGLAEQTTPMAPLQAPEYLRYRGPALEYHHSDGNGTVTRIDHAAPGQSFATPEDRVRELMIARALLRHALHLVDKELNGL